MQLPFLITCVLPSVRVFELSDGRFQLIEQGPISPFMFGRGYLLVEQPLAEFLGELGLERVRYSDAVLFNRGTGEEFCTHRRIHVGQLFQHGQLHDLSLDGPRLLTMNDAYYFASPELKAHLQDSSFSYLRFSEGISGFAADGA